MSGMWNKGPYSADGYIDGRVRGPGISFLPRFCETSDINNRVVEMLNIAYEMGRGSLRDEFKTLLNIKDPAE